MIGIFDTLKDETKLCLASIEFVRTNSEKRPPRRGSFSVRAKPYDPYCSLKGAPRMYSDRKGKVAVKVYFDEDDFKVVKGNAGKAKLDISKFIRKMTLEGEVAVYDFKSAHELVYEINKIGVNVNQLARKANEIHSIYKSDIDKLQQEYEDLCHMLNQFLLDLPSTKA